MKSGESEDRRDEALGQALREAAGLAATGGEPDFEAIYAAAARRPGSSTPIRVSVRRLALALPLAAAAGLALVAGLGEAARSRGFRDEIALLSRRVVGPGGWTATEALYRVPGGVAEAAADPAAADPAAAPWQDGGPAGAPTELGLFVEGLWREGAAGWEASGEGFRAGGEAAGEEGAGAPSF